MELKMINNNLVSNADQNCALKEEELDAVSGGRLSSFRDAMLAFARGDIFGGLQSASKKITPPAASSWL
jgi:hypothetical protein